jgi:alpha-1,2-mannosyltransferase
MLSAVFPCYLYITWTIKSIGAEHEDTLKRPNDSNKKTNIIKIVSVGQFRPEKDHPLQLRAMHELRQLVSEDVWDNVSKVLKRISSCEYNNCKFRILGILLKKTCLVNYCI